MPDELAVQIDVGGKRAEDLNEFFSALARCAPPLAAVLPALTSWEQVKLLSVQLNRLPRWYPPGFICMGDAAHAMSPVGGVGINYAIQDAVALANAVVEPLRAGRLRIDVLAVIGLGFLPEHSR